MTDRDDFGWSPAARADQVARIRKTGLATGHSRVPVLDEVEIELLTDPDYIRVGDRFGGFVLNQDHDGSHFYAFVDYGPYLAPADRPAEAAVAWEDPFLLGQVRPSLDEMPVTESEYEEWLTEREDNATSGAVSVLVAQQVAAAPEKFPILDMRFWLAEQDPKPAAALTIRCQQLRRRKPCRKVIATITETEYGLYGVGRYAPSKFVKDVMTSVESTEFSAQLEAGGAEYEFSPEIQAAEWQFNNSLKHDLHGSESGDSSANYGIALACPDHGNAEIDPLVVIDAARHPTRNQLGVTREDRAGRVWWVTAPHG